MIATLSLLALLAQEAPPDCSQSIGVGYGVGYRPSVPRQGETVELTAMVVRGYGMPLEPASELCVKDWKVEGEGVTLLPGGKIRISAKAMPGTEIKFSAHIGGIRGERGYGSFKIIGATQKVLSGKYGIVSQQGCMTDDIAEMTFSPNGYYTYTLPQDMFETKVTGSGNYRWNGDSGRLELVRDDGMVWQAGTAVERDGQLILENIDPGAFMRDPPDRVPSPVCRIVLR